MNRRAEGLLARLGVAWERSDALFALLAEDALLERPIPLRQPFIFYLGHLPAFAWNQIGRAALGRAPFRAPFDELFERGIDPLDVGEYRPPAADWPHAAEVIEYRDRVRQYLRTAFDGGERALEALAMTLEHEWMHQETLLYMLQQLPFDRKMRPRGLPGLELSGGTRVGRTFIPGGRACLGARPGSIPFGWDNEFGELEVDVPGFTMDGTPVRNEEFLEFVEAGGYAQPGLWTEEGWVWKERQGVRHPLFWRLREGRFFQCTMYEEVPLAAAADWPVYVSHAEATAFALWRGGRLPSEAEFHRAAYGTAEGEVRSHPWGEDPPGARHGNFGFRCWSPVPTGSCPAGASAWGVLDLVGNGWEWTRSRFEPFPGFEPRPSYPGYSRDFFDGRHHVLLGGSWATDVGLLRRSFRNWFQPHYPYVFAKFRCVSAG